MPILTDWEFHQGFPFEHPTLEGRVYGHPKFPDGSHIFTSAVTSFEPHNSRAVTLSTEYILTTAAQGIE